MFLQTTLVQIYTELMLVHELTLLSGSGRKEGGGVRAAESETPQQRNKKKPEGLTCLWFLMIMLRAVLYCRCT